MEKFLLALAQLMKDFNVDMETHIDEYSMETMIGFRMFNRGYQVDSWSSPVSMFVRKINSIKSEV